MEIEKYQISWNAGVDEGTFILQLADGTTATQVADSAQEAMLILDLLRNEKPVMYLKGNGLIMTGFEAVGEGEESKEREEAVTA